MAANPIVSVVIPTRGRANLAREAVTSVFAQTLCDLELWVVVDGEDPETLAMLHMFDDPRLRWVVNSRTLGPGGSRNEGVARSRGRWIAFLDDDDSWRPNKLERQVELAAAQHNPDNCIVMTQSEVITPEGRFVRPTDGYDGRGPVDEWMFGRRTWLKGGQSFIQSSSLLVPAAVLRQLSFATTWLHEDWEFVLRAVKEHGCDLLTVEVPLVKHVVHKAVPSLSSAGTWRSSLEWARAVGPLLTRRAFAGFCLIAALQAAVRNGQAMHAGPSLLLAAFRGGRPTARQLFAFMLIWLLPGGLRRRLRASVQALPSGPTDARQLREE